MEDRNTQKPLTPKSTQINPDNELSAGKPELMLPKPKSHLREILLVALGLLAFLVVWLILHRHAA